MDRPRGYFARLNKSDCVKTNTAGFHLQEESKHQNK